MISAFIMPNVFSAFERRGGRNLWKIWNCWIKAQRHFSLACFHYFLNQWFPFVTANGIIPDTFSCDFFLPKSFHFCFCYLAFVFLSADNWLFFHNFSFGSSWLYNLAPSVNTVALQFGGGLGRDLSHFSPTVPLLTATVQSSALETM